MERWGFILRVLRAIRRHLHFMGELGHWRPGVRWRELTTKSVSAHRRTDMKLSETNLCLAAVAVTLNLSLVARRSWGVFSPQKSWSQDILFRNWWINVLQLSFWINLWISMLASFSEKMKFSFKIHSQNVHDKIICPTTLCYVTDVRRIICTASNNL